MALCQLRNTRAGSYTFNCQIYALEHPPLRLVLLHDLAADFIEGLFRFHIQDYPGEVWIKQSAGTPRVLLASFQDI
jgi:hypothetical protein